LGESIEGTVSDEWRELAFTLASETGVEPQEIIALKHDDVDTVQNNIRIRHGYRYQNSKLTILKGITENIVKMDTGLLKRVSIFTMKSPYIFIFGGNDSSMVLEIADKKAPETRKKLLVLGEIVRKERNILFHSFRHFFNSTIRGTVSDDILRLQTGHSDEKMTNHYDHMTDDRGEQLRKAVQSKILPFIPKVAGE
jgi:integrase